MALFKVVARWEGFQGAPGYSVFHFDADSGDVGGTAGNAAGDVHSFFTMIADRLPTNVRVTVESEVATIDTATGEALSYEQLPPIDTVIGTASGSYAAPVGACVSWTTGTVRRGRRVRGRTFLVPLAGGAFDNSGTLITAAHTDIVAAAAALVGGNQSFVVYGRPSGSGASDGIAAPVTGSRVTDQGAVLRSRRD